MFRLLMSIFFYVFNRINRSPNLEQKRQAPSRDSFQTFEQSTIDAWDDGVDDVLAMNPQVIQSTALQVKSVMSS